MGGHSLRIDGEGTRAPETVPGKWLASLDKPGKAPGIASIPPEGSLPNQAGGWWLPRKPRRSSDTSGTLPVPVVKRA